MPNMRALLWLLLSSTLTIAAAAPTHHADNKLTRQKCQTSPRSCPKDTIIVSNSNATHIAADFTTIQAAIESLPNDNTTQTILILPGSYKEQVNITRAGPITLLGQTDHLTDASKNKVTITWAQANHDNTGQSVDNVFSSVLTVAPTLEASYTGSGPTGYPVPEDTPFGNVDFRAYNIDFTNTWAEYSDGPAHALSLSRANGGFYYCGFYSYQDTVYIGKLGNAYMQHSIIAGQTDFLYGFGTLWIQDSALLLRSCGGGITAWKGTNTTFDNAYGVYIVDSTVKAANSTIAPDMKGKCALGRPWNSLHRSIFANTFEDASIQSSGYIDWVVDGESRFEEGVTMMAEYGVFGPGFNRTGRVQGGVDVLMSKREYQRYSKPEKVFMSVDGKKGNTGWIDWDA